MTNYFYTCKGAHGINIEPSEIPFRKLQERRRRDINVCCAVGAEQGCIKTALSNENMYYNFEKDYFNGTVYEETGIERRMFTDILNEYLPNGQAYFGRP